jgi:hypothetical protein
VLEGAIAGDLVDEHADFSIGQKGRGLGVSYAKAKQAQQQR